jgi:hypothetical protein
MALVNPNIAMSYRQPDIQGPNALAQFAQIQQIQGGRQAQEMNALKMQEAQAAMEERNALRQLNPASADYESQLFRVNPTLGIQYRKERSAAEASGAATAASRAAASTSEFELKAKQRKFVQDLKRDLSSNPSDANIIAFGEDAVLQNLYTPDQVQATVQQLLAIPAADRQQIFAQSGASAAELRPQVVAPGGSLVQGGRVVFTAPERTDTDLIRNFNAAKAGGFTGNLFEYERQIKEAGQQNRLRTPEEEAQAIRIARESRPPAQPRAEQPPVAVVDPATGKQVFVSREEALRGRMTPAAAMESLPPKEIQKREAAYPQATSSVKGFETKSTAFIKDLEALRNHPGLSSITGIAAGRLPGLTADGRAAQAIYDKVVAKGGFQALQDMRDASKTGGALGNVSNQEGKQLTASFAAIDRRQEAKDVQAAIDQAIADIQGSQTRMREAYESTYSYKSGGGGAPSAPTQDVRSQADAILRGGN